MSTKIYGGFICRTTDIRELNKAIAVFKRKLIAETKVKTAQMLITQATHLWDLRHLGMDTTEDKYPTCSAGDSAWITLDTRMTNTIQSRRRDPAVDFSFELVFIPYRSKLLGIVYSEQTEWVTRWLTSPLIREYHYQNHSDPDPSVSAKEWRQRARDWDGALGYNTPADVGWVVNCIPHHMLIDYFSEIRALVAPLPLDTRIKYLEQLRSFEIYTRTVFKDTLTPSNSVVALRKYSAWRRTKEGQAVTLAQDIALREALPAELSWDMLQALPIKNPQLPMGEPLC